MRIQQISVCNVYIILCIILLNSASILFKKLLLCAFVLDLYLYLTDEADTVVDDGDDDDDDDDNDTDKKLKQKVEIPGKGNQLFVCTYFYILYLFKFIQLSF